MERPIGADIFSEDLGQSINRVPHFHAFLEKIFPDQRRMEAMSRTPL